jgi:hypothetical protein
MKANRRKIEYAVALGLGISAAVAACAGAILALKAKKEYVENKEYIKIDLMHNEPDTEVSEELSFEPAEKTVLSFDRACEIALETAKEQFGENAFVVPASEKKPLYVNILGVKRACYMFGADKMDFIDGSMKGLYHVDADTGEVFDNGSGDMKQIRFIS